MPSVLPDKPSELIKLAVKDLVKCEKDPRFIIDMEDWCYRDGDFCAVCLAGSVMAQRLINDLDNTLDEWGFVDPDAIENTSDEQKLYALNTFRMGNIHGGLQNLGHYGVTTDLTGIPPGMKIANYREDPAKFKEQMLALAYDLEKVGL